SRALQMDMRLGPAPEAADAGRLSIQQAEIPVRTGIIEFFVQFTRAFELRFHLRYDFKCADAAGACKLAEVHPHVIMTRGGSRIMVEQMAAGLDSLFRQLSAFR